VQLELFDAPEFAEQRWRHDQQQRVCRIRERMAFHRHRLIVLHRKLESIEADVRAL
jgi:hypothetical protein